MFFDVTGPFWVKSWIAPRSSAKEAKRWTDGAVHDDAVGPTERSTTVALQAFGLAGRRLRFSDLEGQDDARYGLDNDRDPGLPWRLAFFTHPDPTQTKQCAPFGIGLRWRSLVTCHRLIVSAAR